VFVLLNATQTRPDAAQTNAQTAPLVDCLQDQVQYLRGQLDVERQAHSEARRIIAALTKRIPEIEAPREAPGAPTTPAEPAPSTLPPLERRVSWWRMLIGG
jgi:hypothetical protein